MILNKRDLGGYVAQDGRKVRSGMLLRSAHLADATRVRFWGGKEEEIAVVKAFLGCNTDNFTKALDAVDSKYGSMEAYLKGPMGLTDEEILILRDRYLISGTGEKSGKNSP